ncbi:MAG: PEGA domain-containing protein [Myxococcales bacterium]|nr:MAG: PEGA domain-containing protein [Myxococcales bacterium]
MSRSHKGSSVHDLPTVHGAEGDLPAVLGTLGSASRLKATEDTSAGRRAIASSLEATLQAPEEIEPEVPSRLSFASLLPEPTRTTSFVPLADRLEPEDRRDVYRVAGKLGTGGMATVYEAVKEGADGFRKRVALKRIHDHMAEDDRVIELLADEARLASLINHPNVCQVLDFGVDSSGYFMALEYLDGFTLRDIFGVLEEQPQRVKEPRYQRIAARVIAGLAEGLHAAHELHDEKGHSLEVVHRDVSPHNLFVLRSGGVKVADFGVARARNQSHHTATGVLKGKLAYSSPEQLHRGEMDRQTDVFALGVVMWEMLTGQRLFYADSESATIVKICNEPAPDVRARQTHIAPSIAAIVRRALAIDPAQRFKSAREMSSAIERALGVQGDSVPVTDVSEWLFELMGAPREPVRPELERLFAQTASADDRTPPRATSGAQQVARRLAAPPESFPPEAISAGERVVSPSAKLAMAAPTEPSLLAAMRADAVAGATPRVAPPALGERSPPPAVVSALKPVAPSGRSLGVIAGAALALALLCGGAWLALKPSGPGGHTTVAAPAGRAVPPSEVAAPVTPMPVTLTLPSTAAAAPEVVAPMKPSSAPSKAKNTQVMAAPKPSSVASAAAPAAALHQFGTVLVTANGGAADVVVDGRNFGPAPQRVTLPVGVHTVALSISGRGTSSATPVQVDAGASSFITLSVPPARN